MPDSGWCYGCYGWGWRWSCNTNRPCLDRYTRRVCLEFIPNFPEGECAPPRHPLLSLSLSTLCLWQTSPQHSNPQLFCSSPRGAVRECVTNSRVWGLWGYVGVLHRNFPHLAFFPVLNSENCVGAPLHTPTDPHTSETPRQAGKSVNLLMPPQPEAERRRPVEEKRTIVVTVCRRPMRGVSWYHGAST
jgi:hypothetical protein